MADALSPATHHRRAVMGMNIDFEKFFPHHDLLIEIGRIEMAMETLQERAENERAMLQPRLESRMVRLRTALKSLPV
jgi:Tfp pilus assembly protein FimV